jgi:hypothetical protein
MISLTKNLQILVKSLLFFLVFSLVWFTSSFAYAFTTPGTSTPLTEENSVVAKERVQRIGAVEECRKYLKNGDNKTTAKLDKPLDKMGNNKLVGALKSSNNPQPTQAEVDFKRCLEEQGVAPEI